MRSRRPISYRVPRIAPCLAKTYLRIGTVHAPYFRCEDLVRKPTGTTLANIAQIVCLVVIAVAVVRHEFFVSAQPDKLASVNLSDADWRLVTAGGHWIGDPKAPVTLVLFADFECPGCKQFETRSLRPALRKHRGDLAVLFRHYPLTYHPNSYAAARASECANAQGRFAEFADSLFDNQRVLGKRSYADIARGAHIPDLVAFEQCSRATDSLGVIQSDISAATAINMSGTPTIIVNRAEYSATPDSAQLDQLITKALKQTKRLKSTAGLR